jgi:hypothetical protein
LHSQLLLASVKTRLRATRFRSLAAYDQRDGSTSCSRTPRPHPSRGRRTLSIEPRAPVFVKSCSRCRGSFSIMSVLCRVRDGHALSGNGACRFCDRGHVPLGETQHRETRRARRSALSRHATGNFLSLAPRVFRRCRHVDVARHDVRLFPQYRVEKRVLGSAHWTSLRARAQHEAQRLAFTAGANRALRHHARPSRPFARSCHGPHAPSARARHHGDSGAAGLLRDVALVVVRHGPQVVERTSRST